MTNKKWVLFLGGFSLLGVSSTASAKNWSFCNDKDPVFESYQNQFCDGKDLNSSKIQEAFSLSEKQVDHLFRKKAFWSSKGSSDEEILANLEKYTTIASKKMEVEAALASDLAIEVQKANKQISEADSAIDKLNEDYAKKTSIPTKVTKMAELLKKCLESGKSDEECSKTTKEDYMQQLATEKKENIEAKQNQLDKITEQENVMQALAETLIAQKDKFNKAYQKNFGQYAIDKLKAVGVNANSLKDVEKVCFGESIEDKAKEACKAIIADTDKYIALNAQVEEQLKKAKKTKSKAELLGLKLNNDILSDKLARNAVLSNAKEQLEGTVIGEMLKDIQGMKDDMCNIAVNSQNMCPTTMSLDFGIGDFSREFNKQQPKVKIQGKQPASAEGM